MSVNVFTVKDAHEVMNTLVRTATGQESISVVDTSSFIDAGTTTLATGVENVTQSLSVLIGNTLIKNTPYTGKFKLISNTSEGEFGARQRKIRFYAQDNTASGMYNTDVATNLGNGLDDTDGVGSQWEQKLPMIVEKYFFSEFAWDKHYTVYPEQLKIAFTNEADFIAFINGLITEVMNDIESTMEAKNRLCVLDRLAGNYLMVKNGDLDPDCAVNLIKAFNDEFGTHYSLKEVLQEHTIAFIKFFLARFKHDSNLLTNRSVKFHDPLTKTVDGVDYNVLNFTPKSKQKFLYYEPLFTQLSLDLAEIFNPQMLSLPNGEEVEYWQSINSPSEIDITPALPDGADSEEVNLKYVVGLLFDSDALMTQNKFTGAYTTPVNARHVYQNTFYHYKYGVIQDYSENAILYYLADETRSEDFEGDGTTTEFTLTGDVIEIVSVTVGGEATTAYTYDADDKTITFTTAPADDSAIVVTYRV